MVLAADDWRECEGRKATERLDALGLVRKIPENLRSNGSNEPRLRDRKVDSREDPMGEEARLSWHG
jgi:hypothetical protein